MIMAAECGTLVEVRRFRDLSGLEAAVMRPESGYYPDVIAEAAPLWESLLQNHPFVDDNKRTAVLRLRAHLAINGLGLHAEELEAYPS